MKRTVSMKLVINVTYIPKNAKFSDLQKCLGNVALMAAQQGSFTQGTDAIVQTWGWRVTRA